MLAVTTRADANPGCCGLTKYIRKVRGRPMLACLASKQEVISDYWRTSLSRIHSLVSFPDMLQAVIPR